MPEEVKRLTLFVWLSLVVLTVQAQRHGCVITKGTTRANHQVLPMPYDFDPQKTYRLPVVLIAFSDADFTMPDPQSYYHRMLNEKGYNEGGGLVVWPTISGISRTDV